MKNRGITGTRNPSKQITSLLAALEWLQTLDPDTDEIINGVCIGMDTIIGRLAYEFGYKVHGVVPSDRSKVSPDWRDWCTTFEEMPSGTNYMDRNSRIVELSDDLTAFPLNSQEELRSGTWSTIRRARKKGIPITIIPVGESQ